MADMTHRYTGKDYVWTVPPDGTGIQIKHKDFFSMKHLYAYMHEWLVEEGWATRKDPDFPEKFYYQREDQKSGNELWIWWRFIKTHPSGSTFFQYRMDIDMHVILLKDTEVVNNGVKYKANTGEPEIKIFAKIERDPKGAWRNHPFLKHIYTLFIMRIFKKDIEVHKKELYREIYRFQEFIKTHLNIATYLPEPEGQQFHLDENLQ